MAIREGRWDCNYCGTTGLLGRDKLCTNCGHPRPEGVRFYLPEDSDIVKDEALLKKAQAGPDWICEYCGASNHATRQSCRQCEAPRGEALSQEVKDYKGKAVPRSGDNAPLPDEPEAKAEAKAEPPTTKGQSGCMGTLISLAVIPLLCLFMFNFFFSSHEFTATVTGFSWERTISVEEEKSVTDDGWGVPETGRLIEQEERIRSYEQVLEGYQTSEREVSEEVLVGTRSYICGQRDLGNGFFEDIECEEPVYETQTRTERYQEPIYRQVPIYDTWYTYQIERWIETRVEQSYGENQDPKWPPLTLTDVEREGERNEQYMIYLVDDEDEAYELDLPLQRWQSFALGDELNLKIDRVGNVELVDE